MTDLELLDGLWAQYRAELALRKDGVRCEGYQFRPNNKSRLNRLRLEIQSLMLRMERKMAFSDDIKRKEGWY